MKKTLVVFVFILILTPSKAQFSGIITYQESYQSKNSSILNTDLETFMGTKRELYIRGAFYKTIRKGNPVSVMLYRSDENKVYRFGSMNDTILWMDASLDTLSQIGGAKVED